VEVLYEIAGLPENHYKSGRTVFKTVLKDVVIGAYLYHRREAVSAKLKLEEIRELISYNVR